MIKYGMNDFWLNLGCDISGLNVIPKLFYGALGFIVLFIVIIIS